jgi:hypothetical protein
VGGVFGTHHDATGKCSSFRATWCERCGEATWRASGRQDGKGFKANSGGNGVTEVIFDLQYYPSLLNINGTLNDQPGSTFELVSRNRK